MTEAKKNYLLLDVLKLMALLAIQVLHTWEFVFITDYFTLWDKSIFYRNSYAIARTFSLGGQILVAIVFLLFGLRGKSRLYLFKVAGFAAFGQICLALVFMDGFGFVNAIEWDIYGFLFFTCLVLSIIPEKIRSSWILISLSLIVLLISPSYWQELFPAGKFYDVLCGRFSPYNSGGWAPVPWFFHCMLYFSLGDLIRKNPDPFHRFNKFEYVLWSLILLSCLPFIGAYFDTPIGLHYYDFSFNRPSYIFWMNFLPFVFVMRMSLIDSFQSQLASSRWITAVSKLYWIRHTGLTYLLAILFTGFCGVGYEEEFKSTPYLIDLFFIGVLVVPEFAARILVKLGWWKKPT